MSIPEVGPTMDGVSSLRSKVCGCLFSNVVIGGFGYAKGSAEGNIIVEISERGTLRPEGSVNEPDKGVGGKDGRVGKGPNCPRLALEEVGVRPGTASKKSAFERVGEL